MLCLVIAADTGKFARQREGLEHRRHRRYVACLPLVRNVARRFIKHLTQSKVMAKFNAVQGHLPVRHSIWKTEPYFAADPLMQKIYAIHLAAPMKIAGSSPMYPAAREAISGRMADVVAGILAPTDAVDQAGEEVMAAYKRLITR